MIYCWELKNRENHFVATAFLEVNRERSNFFDSFFDDKIGEYNWEEDQSNENALTILRDTLLDVKDYLKDNSNFTLESSIGLEGNNDFCQEKIHKNEFTYYCRYCNGFISFNSDYKDKYRVDYICSKNHEIEIY